MNNRKITIVNNLIWYIIICVLVFIFVFPLLWIFSTALKTRDQLFVYPPVLIPKPVAWDNFKKAINAIPFLLYLKNTLIIVVFSLLGDIISSSFVAYGFSRIDWPGRDILFLVLLGTMMIPYQVTLIPLFIVYRMIGWVNTFFPLTVPSFFATAAFHVFLLRQFYHTIPKDLSDAAYIDGCSDLRIWWKIILPLAKPALVTVGIFNFINHWNDFLGPLIYLQEDKKYTLAIGLYAFRNEFGTDWNLMMAAAILMVIPLVALFLSAQKVFVSGITLTGLKG